MAKAARKVRQNTSEGACSDMNGARIPVMAKRNTMRWSWRRGLMRIRESRFQKQESRGKTRRVCGDREYVLAIDTGMNGDGLELRGFRARL
jgi:hypothetical protein